MTSTTELADKIRAIVGGAEDDAILRILLLARAQGVTVRTRSHPRQDFRRQQVDDGSMGKRRRSKSACGTPPTTSAPTPGSSLRKNFAAAHPGRHFEARMCLFDHTPSAVRVL
jgi:hypothetical protein